MALPRLWHEAMGWHAETTVYWCVQGALSHRSLPDCERVSRPGLIGELRSQPLLRGGLRGSSLVRLKGGSCNALSQSLHQEASMSISTGVSGMRYRAPENAWWWPARCLLGAEESCGQAASAGLATFSRPHC